MVRQLQFRRTGMERQRWLCSAAASGTGRHTTRNVAHGLRLVSGQTIGQKGRAHYMKYYLIITTTIGILDLSHLRIYYRTKKEAERQAEIARSLPDTINVEIKSV